MLQFKLKIYNLYFYLFFCFEVFFSGPVCECCQIIKIPNLPALTVVGEKVRISIIGGVGMWKEAWTLLLLSNSFVFPFDFLCWKKKVNLKTQFCTCHSAEAVFRPKKAHRGEKSVVRNVDSHQDQFVPFKFSAPESLGAAATQQSLSALNLVLSFPGGQTLSNNSAAIRFHFYSVLLSLPQFQPTETWVNSFIKLNNYSFWCQS